MNVAELHARYDELPEPELDVQRTTKRTVVRTLRRLRDEANALQKFYSKEARKLSGWKTLNRTDKHVARHLARLMTAPHSGEVFKNERALCLLIPPAPSKRGRPNASGHIHRDTLRASLGRIEAAGIFTSWKTLGKKTGQWRAHYWRNGRTPAIRVWRLNRDAWAHAWGTFKQTARRGILYQVKAEAFRRGKRERSGAFQRGKTPLWLRDNDSQARRYTAKVEHNARVQALKDKFWAAVECGDDRNADELSFRLSVEYARAG